MKEDRLSEILSLVIAVKDERGNPLPKSMQSTMIAALIKHDGMIEAAKIQGLKINELACYLKDAGDVIKEGLEYIGRMSR